MVKDSPAMQRAFAGPFGLTLRAAFRRLSPSSIPEVRTGETRQVRRRPARKTSSRWPTYFPRFFRVEIGRSSGELRYLRRRSFDIESDSMNSV